jgi:hypothetical protein
MNRPRCSFDGFPLFPGESGIWDSLDKPTQEEVLDCLALLLLRYLQHTARCAVEEQPLTQGHLT